MTKGKNFQIVFFVFGFLFVSQILHAAEKAISLSLYDSLLMARQKSVNVLLARENVKQATLKLKEAQSTLYPQLMATASQYRVTRNLESQGFTIPGRDSLIGPFNTFDARIKLMQNIFDASALSTIGFLKTGRALSRDQEAQSRQSSVVLVGSLYFEAKRAFDRLILAKTLLKSDQKQLEILNTGYQNGSHDLLSRAQAQSHAQTSEEQLTLFEIQAQNRASDLLVALGFAPDQKVIFKKNPVELKTPLLPTEEQIELAIKKHPDLQMAKDQLLQAEADKKVQWASFLPTLSFKADYGASGTTPQNARGTYAYGSEVNIPIEQGGLKIHRVHASESRIRQATSTLSDTQNKVLNEAIKARQIIVSSTQSLKSNQSSLQTARQNYQIALNRKNTGLGNQNEVLQASSALALAQDSTNESRVTLELAQLNLVYTMGQIDLYLDEIEGLKNHENKSH